MVKKIKDLEPIYTKRKLGLSYWLNVDKPTKKCTVHVEGCVYERNKRETLRKGIERIKVDGGWFSFLSLREIKDYYYEKWASQGYELSEDCQCLDTL